MERLAYMANITAVTVKATQDGNATYAPISDTVSFTIGEKQGQEMGIPSYFTAYGNVDLMILCHLENARQRTNHSRMVRFVQVGDFIINPVNREQVLNEIVRTNTEKIDFAGKHVTDRNGGRSFNHTTHLNLFVKRNVHFA